MLNLRVVVGGIVLVGFMMSVANLSHAQEYPTKPIRIVTSALGGGTDLAARIIAQGLSASLGQPVIVDNRPLGLRAVIVAKAPPDGHTLLVGGETLWVTALLQQMPYDPVRDFAAITTAVTAPDVLVVTPSLPVKSVKDLIDLAKVKKGELDYGSGANGSSAHLAGELFKSLAGVSMVRIPHKGTGDMLISLLSGQVQLAFVTIPAATPHMKSGKLRGIAVAASRPTALLPGLPTVAATVPGFTSGGQVAVFAPPGTSPTIISRLNREVVRFLNTAEVKERFFNAGFEVEGGSAQELTATIKSEMVRMGKVIKDAGIRVE